MVARVVEPAFPEPLRQGLRLHAGGEIPPRLAREDLVEGVEMRRDPLGDRPIRGGREHDPAASLPLGANPLEQVLPPRHRRRVEFDRRRDAALEGGPAPEQRHAERRKTPRPAKHDPREPFPHQVRPQQRAVEVDCQHPRRGRRGAGRLAEGPGFVAAFAHGRVVGP
jgi:hypothetical protein